MELVKLNNTGMTSLKLVEQINIFRKEEDNKSELAHSDLLKIIREEFEEEIAEGNISCGSYKDNRLYLKTNNLKNSLLNRKTFEIINKDKLEIES